MFGLSVADILVIAAYFVALVVIGMWAMMRVKNQEDYFLAGRRFGKLIQTFAAFGQATNSDTAVSVSTTTFRNGAAGIWSALNSVFATPIYWLTSPLYRRLRLMTLGDFFEERYGSKPMAAVYAWGQAVLFMVALSLGFNAIGKTVMALTPKVPGDTTKAERMEAAQAQRLEKLEAADYENLTQQQRTELHKLRQTEPRSVFSYVNKNMLILIVGGVVLVYAVAGGLEAAFVSDLLQGLGIIVLSVVLIPFAFFKVNKIYGGEGILAPFRILHDKIPEANFEIFGSASNLDFTWYYIMALVLMITVNITAQANQFVATSSAKDEFTARTGFVGGMFLKRFCTILWGLIALFAILLYSGQVRDSDLIWGYATRDLLGPLNIGLVGLMIACLLAALMSTADALMITSSSLLTHNFYRVIISDRSEAHYVKIGRVLGVVVIIGGILLTFIFESLLNQLKITWELNIIFAAPFILGILWRRANKISAWSAILFALIFFYLIPIFAPVVYSGLRTNDYLLSKTQGQVVTREYTAREMDVSGRQEKIEKWEELKLRNKRIGPKPEPLEVGEDFMKTYAMPQKSIFWSQGIKASEDGKDEGRGMLNLELVVYDQLGFDMSQNTYAMNETVKILTRTILPFLIVFGLSYVTPWDNKKRLDRFFAKMKTHVNADREKDNKELALSYENPQRFDNRKMFPGTHWEFCKWNKEDAIGFIVATLISFAIVGFLYLVVSIGA